MLSVKKKGKKYTLALIKTVTIQIYKNGMQV